jgi:hypothetical protein
MLLGGIPLGIVCGALCYAAVQATVKRLKTRQVAVAK